MTARGIIFDLDGVIVSTDDYHYQAWKRLADEQGIYFDRRINERLRGVSRTQSLEIILEKAKRRYSYEEKRKMADRKNSYYIESLKTLTPDKILPGVTAILEQLKQKGACIAVATSSKNSQIILERIALSGCFDATVDGNDITASKPDPEVFLLAARRLALKPDQCMVIEDAKAGVTAALAAGMRVLALGSAANDRRAHLHAVNLASVTVEEILT